VSNKLKKKKKTPKIRQMPNIPPQNPTEDRINLTEVQYLKFRLTKANEELIYVKEQKLASDEQIVGLSKQNLELQKSMSLTETGKVYDEVGIVPGDRVIQEGDKFLIVRHKSRTGPGVPPTPKPQKPLAPPAPPEEDDDDDDDDDDVEPEDRDEGGSLEEEEEEEEEKSAAANDESSVSTEE